MISFGLVKTLPETAPNALEVANKMPTPELNDVETAASWTGYPISKYPQLLVFLAAKAIIGLSYLLMEFSFSLYTSERFELSHKANGFVLGYAGLVAVIAQMGVVTSLKQRFSERLLVIIGAALLSFSLLGIAAASTLTVFLVAVAFLSLGRAIFRTVCDAVVLQAVDPEDFGSISGACDAVDSGCRVSAPLIGGLLIEWYGVASPPCLGGVLIIFGIIIIQTQIQWQTATSVKKES
jgi:predicted MFS family arabinose efflux permease